MQTANTVKFGLGLTFTKSQKWNLKTNGYFPLHPPLVTLTIYWRNEKATCFFQAAEFVRGQPESTHDPENRTQCLKIPRHSFILFVPAVSMT